MPSYVFQIFSAAVDAAGLILCFMKHKLCFTNIFWQRLTRLRGEGRIWPGRPSGASVLMNPSISRLANTILPTIHNRFWPNPVIAKEETMNFQILLELLKSMFEIKTHQTRFASGFVKGKTWCTFCTFGFFS